MEKQNNFQLTKTEGSYKVVVYIPICSIYMHVIWKTGLDSDEDGVKLMEGTLKI